uniref:Uncharacterized protein n=1 Tax=Anguilla anguilla TaxID=7936 RepID=A0A0E9VX29_ANGAN
MHHDDCGINNTSSTLEIVFWSKFVRDRDMNFSEFESES